VENLKLSDRGARKGEVLAVVLDGGRKEKRGQFVKVHFPSSFFSVASSSDSSPRLIDRTNA